MTGDLIAVEFESMGTVICVDILDDGRERAVYGTAFEEVERIFRRLDELFSLWKPESAMSRLRRGQLDAPPPEMQPVFELCDMARELTHGWYAIDALPGGTDPTGVVKGWAGQRALDALIAAGIKDAMVNAAGDVASCGGPGAGWRIGIQHPGSRAHLIGIVEGTGAVATSGIAERGEHLYDPFEKRHAAAAVSATVVGADLALADALATALCVAGPAGLVFIEEIDGYEGLTMTRDGVTKRSSGWKFAAP